MVRKYVRKTDRAGYTREKLLEAIKRVKDGHLSAYRASILYAIPRATIVARLYGRYGQKSQTLGKGTVIPQEIEKIIANNLHEMVKNGFGFTKSEVTELVGHYLMKNNIKNSFKNNIPGGDWLFGFKKRHNLTIKPHNIERTPGCNPFVIYPHFETLKRVMDELDIHDKPSQIWNLDETSFSPSKIKVVGLNYGSMRRLASFGEDNKTVLFGCNAAGSKIPPLITFKGNDILDEWTEEDYPGTMYAATENGCMRRDVFETFFENVFMQVGQERPILVIYNGHSTHISMNLIEKARKERIAIIKIPPHMSDILQPLDLAMNESFKEIWDLKLVTWQILNVGQILSEKEFGKMIGEVWAEVDPNLCISGFKKAGVIPFNNDIVPEDKFTADQVAKWKKHLQHRNELKEKEMALALEPRVQTAEPFWDPTNCFPPRMVKVSNEQMDLLLDHLLCNPMLAKGYGCGRSRDASERLWNELASKLNAKGRGTKKSGLQWKKYWLDLKHKAKCKAMLIHRDRNAPDGGLNLKPLSLTYQKVLQIVSEDANCGDTQYGVPTFESETEVNIQYSPKRDMSPPSDPINVIDNTDRLTDTYEDVKPALSIVELIPGTSQMQRDTPSPTPSTNGCTESPTPQSQRRTSQCRRRARRNSRSTQRNIWAMKLAKQRIAIEERISKSIEIIAQAAMIQAKVARNQAETSRTQSKALLELIQLLKNK